MSHTEGPCGCFLSHRSGGLEDPDIIEYCPLHAEAPAMLAALKGAVTVVDVLSKVVHGNDKVNAEMIARWNDLISRAEGES